MFCQFPTVAFRPIASTGGRWEAALADACATLPHCLGIVPSEIDRAQAQRAGVPIENLRVLPPCFATASRAAADRAELRAAMNLPVDAFVLATASPASAAGAQSVVAWATAILWQIWPDVRVLLPDRLEEFPALVRFVERLSDPTMAVLLDGGFSRDDVLAAADVLALPSASVIHLDWLRQAMETGVPIVAADSRGIRPWLVDKQTGLLVQAGQPQALAIAIRQIRDDQQAAAAMAARAKASCASLFDDAGTLQAIHTFVRWPDEPDRPARPARPAPTKTTAPAAS
jgi:hypothetical protein